MTTAFGKADYPAAVSHNPMRTRDWSRSYDAVTSKKGQQEPVPVQRERASVTVTPAAQVYALPDEVLYVVGGRAHPATLIAVVRDLRSAGYTVFSALDVVPLALDWVGTPPSQFAADRKACLEVLLQEAGRVVLVDGWQDDPFAHTELKVAQAMTLPISDYDVWDATGMWMDMPPVILYRMEREAPSGIGDDRDATNTRDDRTEPPRLCFPLDGFLIDTALWSLSVGGTL